MSTNDASRYSLTKSIVTRGTFEIGETLKIFEAQSGSADKTIFEGKVYSDKAPLGSFLGVVPAYIAHILFGDDKEYWRILVMSVFVAALPMAVTGGLIYLLALGYGARRELAVLIACGAVFGSNLLYWSTVMFSHSLSTCLVVSSFYLIRRDGERNTQIIAGLLAGLAVASDYYLILVLPVLFVAGSFSRYRRRAWPFVLGAVVAGCVPALYHTAIFGNPFVLPYKHQATFAVVHSQGVYGMVAPSLTAIWHMSFSQYYGLFFYNPFLLLALYAGPKFYRRSKRDFYLFTSMTVILFLAISSIRAPSYGFGFSWGPRYLMPLVPFLALMVAAIRPRGVQLKLLWCFLIVSVGLNYFIVNLFVVPPMFSAMEYMCGDGMQSLRQYGGFHLLTQWFMSVRGQPLNAGAAGFVSVLLLMLPAAALFHLIRKENGNQMVNVECLTSIPQNKDE